MDRWLQLTAAAMFDKSSAERNETFVHRIFALKDIIVLLGDVNASTVYHSTLLYHPIIKLFNKSWHTQLYKT